MTSVESTPGDAAGRRRGAFTVLLGCLVGFGCYGSHGLLTDADAVAPEADTAVEVRPDSSDDAGLPDRPPDAGADDGTPPDVYPDAADAEVLDWDLGPPSDGVDYETEAPPPIDEVPGCGNGVLDPDEECDDRNRLDGDGCDWLCRLGDGDPAPAADPDTAAYVPSGEPTIVELGPEDDTELAPFPLTWNGTEYATVTYAHGTDGASGRLTFLRFDREGRRFGSVWAIEAPWLWFGHDLVWNGAGYGLFFSDADRGIFFVRLDAEGKPLSPPVLVEPDPQARNPTADLADGGYVLAWVHEGYPGPGWSLCGGWSEPPDSTRLRLVGTYGETSGEPLIVEAESGGSVDVAAGDGGFGLSMWMNSSPAIPTCAQRFAWVPADLSRVVGSGILSAGVVADVKWAAGRYYTAWTHYDTMVGGHGEVCVARFTPEGLLERPPVCNEVFPADAELGVSAARTAAGDEGLAVVVSGSTTADLFFLRTDLTGVAVGAPHEILPCDRTPRPGDCRARFGAYNTVWADHGFGVLFAGNFRFPELEGDLLLLQTFVAE